jgi:hypothetical protein
MGRSRVTSVVGSSGRTVRAVRPNLSPSTYKLVQCERNPIRGPLDVDGDIGCSHLVLQSEPVRTFGMFGVIPRAIQGNSVALNCRILLELIYLAFRSATLRSNHKPAIASVSSTVEDQPESSRTQAIPTASVTPKRKDTTRHDLPTVGIANSLRLFIGQTPGYLGRTDFLGKAGLT